MDVTAISADCARLVERMDRETNAALQLLTDPSGAIIDRLGLRDHGDQERDVVAVPAAFLLDRQRIVQFHYRGRAAEDRPRIELLMLAAEHLT